MRLHTCCWWARRLGGCSAGGGSGLTAANRPLSSLINNHNHIMNPQLSPKLLPWRPTPRFKIMKRFFFFKVIIALPAIDFHPNDSFSLYLIREEREIKCWSNGVRSGVWAFTCVSETEMLILVLLLETRNTAMCDRQRRRRGDVQQLVIAPHVDQVTVCWELYNEAAAFMWIGPLIPQHTSPVTW